MLLEQLSVHAWIKNNSIRTETGDILDFSKYRFMYDIYADRSRLICCMKCLDPNTKVLTSDLEWKKLRDISVGDKLFSVDEDNNSKKGRRFRTAIVERKWKSRQEACIITLEDGRKFTSSYEHKFLARKYPYKTDTVWKKVSELKVGEVVRNIVQPWGDSNYEDGWFGGIIDGEGHIRTQSGVQIDIVQKPGEISDKIEDYLKKNNIKFRKDARNKKGFTKDLINCFEVSGSEDSLRLFGKCKPVKFTRNPQVFENKKIGGVGRSWVKIVSIEYAGKKDLIDIQTSTKTFIAEGIVTHNCAQIGFTTYEILKTAHECKNEKIDILYVLPTQDDVKRFSGGKTNKILSQNPVLNSWTKDKDSVEQKQFGDNTVYYQGSWTERAALMITAKKIVIDEYDRCKQSIVEQYDSRLQSISDPKKAFFSNPSIPDFGIDKFYQQSDQKKWHVKHSCGETFVMDESCIDYKQEKYICPKCTGEITDEERRMGEWVATSQGEWSGYWIPLWIAPWMKASDIAKYKREKTPEYFANFVAGLPYVGTNNALSQATLEKCLSSVINDQENRTIIGVDTGHNIHYTLMNKQGTFFHGYCPSVAENPIPNYDPYTELEKLLDKFKGSIIVADQGGDLIGIRKLQAKYPGRVFLCWFTKETKSQQIIRWGEDKEFGKVLVDRNRAVQLVVDQINDARLPFNGTREDWQPYFNHWLNIYRVKEFIGEENDPQYGWKWVWKRKGADHWAMATIYAVVGLDKFSEQEAKIIGDDMWADIPTGRIFQE